MSIASASFIRFSHHFDLVGNLRAAQHGDERPFRIRNRLTEIGELLFHQQAGGRLANKLRDAHNRGVGAMGGAERVAHEKLVAERRELLRKLRIVGFFFGMKADVFEQQHVAIAKRLALRFALRRPHNRRRIRPASREARAAGRRRAARLYFGFTLPFGPAQMRGKHQTCAALDGQTKSRQRLADARVVANFAALERDVEINTNENTLAAHLQIANR